MIIYLKAELFEFSYLQQNAFDKEDSYCPLKRQIPLFKLVNRIFDMHFHFESHDKARSFFLELQNEIKNLNFMPFNSERYEAGVARIEETLQQAAMKERELLHKVKRKE